MDRSKPGWLKRIALVGGSCFVVFAFLLAGEAYCRLFTSINFLDNSRGMFTPERFGNSFGNTPNFEGTSFGAEFFTDENGFRVGARGPAKAPIGQPAVLLLGDSVGFGTGISDDLTMAGLLRAEMTGRTVYNASVIGYDSFDYKNAGEVIVDAKPEIRSVIVLFCLNDVNDASAQQIRSQTAIAGAAGQDEGGGPFRILNDYLRSRSKLYLWLKNLLRDTRMIYFRSDLASYEKGTANVDAAIEPLAMLKSELDAKGVTMRVYILPYEAQLRPSTGSDFLLPQRLLAEAFQKKEIDFRDLAPAFASAGRPASDLFLYGDPMHLNAAGSKIAADAICADLGTCTP